MRDYEFGKKLYALRTECGYTQEYVAHKVGVSDKAVSKWENGTSKPTTSNIRKLAQIFDVSVESLLTLKDENDIEEKKIVKIVLTGGPCAGKTTAMNWIQNFFTKKGYKVLFVSEAATELITSGVTLNAAKSVLEFQRSLLRLMLAKEKVIEESALNMKDNKILIVCDRGVLDNKAYMSQREFNKLLSSENLSEVKVRDGYDAVFHLVTAAKGAEKFYNLDNTARSETIEEAISLDDKIISSWTGHPHFRVIDNSTDFETKMKKLLSEISAFIGEPEPYEIERKFLIEYPDISYLESLPYCQKVQIVQTYLKSNKNEEVRVRQRGLNGEYTYSKTTKIDISSVKRIELEERISSEEYLNLLLQADPNKMQIIKDRYCLTYGNKYFEIDVYPLWNDKAILEIELSNADEEVNIPEFISVIKEVTDDKEYKNSSLARIKTIK